MIAQKSEFSEKILDVLIKNKKGPILMSSRKLTTARQEGVVYSVVQYFEPFKPAAEMVYRVCKTFAKNMVHYH